MTKVSLMLKIQDYLNDCIPLNELEKWIVARLPVIYESGGKDVTNIVSFIMLHLIEMEKERLTENEFKKLITNKMIYFSTENTPLNLVDKGRVMISRPRSYASGQSHDDFNLGHHCDIVTGSDDIQIPEAI